VKKGSGYSEWQLEHLEREEFSQRMRRGCQIC
jgi:hypothetical protein